MAIEQAAPVHVGLARLVPGVAVLGSYRRPWLRPDLTAGVVLAAILVPQGVRRTRGPAARHGAVHDHRVPRRLCLLWAVADPRPRAGFVGLAADLRGDRALGGGRRSDDRDRTGGHDGADRGRDRDRARARQAGVRRRPAVARGAGRLHERPRGHDHRRPAAETLWLLHGCRRLRPGDEGVRDGPRPDEPNRPDYRRRYASLARRPDHRLGCRSCPLARSREETGAGGSNDSVERC